jgi:hypothetical protein
MPISSEIRIYAISDRDNRVVFRVPRGTSVAETLLRHSPKEQS